MKVEYKLTVNRSPEDIWKFMFDLKNVPKWDPGTMIVVGHVSIKGLSTFEGEGRARTRVHAGINRPEKAEARILRGIR